MRAAALRNPRARVIRALSWAFSASARPFEGPWSKVFQISVPEPGERFRQFREFRDAGPVSPGDQPGEQRLPVASLDPERLAELLFYEVALVERLVVGGDPGQGGALPGGQVLRFLPQCPHSRAERGGLVSVPGGAEFGGETAAELVEPFARPFHDMEGVQADQGLRGLFPDDVVDPLRPVC